MNKRALLKRPAVALALILTFGILFSSCLQMRMTEKKQAKKLAKVGLEPEFGYKQGLDRAIHYTLTGKDSSKRMVVFVHGSPGSSSNFLKFAYDSSLLEKYQVLLLDRPGFGYSDFGQSERSIIKQAQILNAVIAQFEAPEKVLVGHSLGGPIIVCMAMDTTIEIDGLMLVAGSVSPELEPEEFWRKPMDKPWLRWILPTSMRVSNQEIMNLKQELTDIEPHWTNIKIPVTVIQGGKDKLVPANNANYAKERLVNSPEVRMMLYPKLNHFIPFRQPELMVDALLTFPF